MSDVIAAVSTGNQVSAIGIIRLTGDGCGLVAGKVFTLNSNKPLFEAPDKKLCLGQLHDKSGRVIDSCCAICSRAFLKEIPARAFSHEAARFASGLSAAALS